MNKETTEEEIRIIQTLRKSIDSLIGHNTKESLLKAVVQSKQCVKIYQKYYAPEHPMLALEKLTIAKLLWNLNDFNASFEAKEWCLQALKAFEISQGKGFKSTAQVRKFLQDIQKEVPDEIS